MDDDGAASPSPSPSPSRSPSPLPIADPVTVAAVPPGHLALAIPIHKHGPSNGGGGGGGGGREDAWSDGATSTLIDAWGERFVALGRGSLRHPQWQEVAEVVSSRDGYSKPPKSDVQCKNRIDTLKKKYKVEKAKSDSSWPFFDRLDFLLAPVQKLLGNSGGPAGNSGSNPNNRSTAPMAPRVNFPQRTRTAFPSSGMKRRLPSPPQASASSESSDGFPPEPLAEAVNGKRQRLEESANGADSSDRAQGLRDLAQAIRRLGETYERVESSKGEHELRMERNRLDAARELEDQRVQFFLKMQMEISKANNGAPLAVPLAAAAMVGNSASTAEDGDSPATADGNGPRRASMATDVMASSNHHVRYRVKDDRHHHASQRPSYLYNENNVVAADAGGIGSGSDSSNKEDEEEMEDEEEESQ
ncbi:trihelix transcription factor ASIL1-like [Triticum dicoccoides]|uniref:trihelix transcription factor ASIL1-like n=1 Tax=Triticum dicoccoides TaxID=85692 RepID=UPI001891088D|nr:trihelix transcription factor ASIL1-like [Triticum dicoccoides]